MLCVFPPFTVFVCFVHTNIYDLDISECNKYTFLLYFLFASKSVRYTIQIREKKYLYTLKEPTHVSSQLMPHTHMYDGVNKKNKVHNMCETIAL